MKSLCEPLELSKKNFVVIPPFKVYGEKGFGWLDPLILFFTFEIFSLMLVSLA
jgi:hypothetical protein